MTELDELVGGCIERSERPAGLPFWPVDAAAVARYPGAVWAPAGDDLGWNGGPAAFAWHTAITTAESIRGWVGSSNAAQGYVGPRGNAEQYKDFDRAAYGVMDGNFEGVVTIESWDGLDPATATWDDVNRDRWPDQMCERIADWIAWGKWALGIPIRRLHRTDSTGHGPHRTGIERTHTSLGARGDLYEGPGHWSGQGKPCCGDQRILQLYGPGLDGGQGSILARAEVIYQAVVAGRCGWLPTGDVDLPAALARTGDTPIPPAMLPFLVRLLSRS